MALSTLAVPARKDRVLLTATMSDALAGKNLGSAGYSYDFVANLFQPLLERWAEVVPVPQPEKDLDREVARARRDGRAPIHVSFRPFHHAVQTCQAPNVLVPAWEFPDIPDHEFDGNPCNNWVRMANDCDLVIVGGPFTRETFERGGVTTPIHIVQVPVPERYFGVAAWEPDQRTPLDCPVCVYGGADAPMANGEAPAGVPSKHLALARSRVAPRLYHWGKRIYQQHVRPRIPKALDIMLTASAYSARHMWQSTCPYYKPVPGIDLSGIVFTSIFNPGDGRKNWEDMLTAFLLGLRDRDDATLVLKLISSNGHAIHRVFQFYRNLDLTHRCRLVIVSEFLSDAQMLELVQASTYYVNTARAEGNCLPLMNYLAAGRPGIAPVHTAIGDYFSTDLGFAIASHPEPAAWPQDVRLRCRTTWHRLVWPSLVEQFQAAYALAKDDLSGYRELAWQARATMRRWAGYEAVWPRLARALAQLGAEREASAVRTRDAVDSSHRSALAA